MRELDDLVSEQAGDGVEENEETVDELRDAHEERLVPPPEFLALHGKEVGQPRGAEVARVEPVSCESDETGHRPLLFDDHLGGRRKHQRVLASALAIGALKKH